MAALTAATALLAAACGSSPSPSAAPSRSTAAASTEPGSQGQGSPTVWLCRPGQAEDPCAAPLQATVVPADGARTVQNPSASTGSAFDCFYVYPTVSTQHSDNSDLRVQPAEVDAAVAQASGFSQVCRVWAPMYRQRTQASLLKGLGADPAADDVAYDSLLSAWRDYLAHDNDNRPVIFIGHSQGAAMLIRLLAGQVDPDPALRARTVVAILAGGNVTVPTGKAFGTTFHHLPICTATAQSGCVIAYSSFPSQPPSNSDFGRPGQGVSLQSGQTATSGVQVACVNPAALGGGSADLDSSFPTATSTPPPPPVTTPWVDYPDLYSAACQSVGGATWLQVDTLATAGRPVVAETLGPAWGYHLDDINLALGNLVDDVTAEEAGFAARH
ncbi:MAG TPA: DUF3089 domain-containing protein [Acidimicrobiales bacterium]|nr:DUF3089 domain-containing protein [Acidimicrobiales bacterium]